MATREQQPHQETHQEEILATDVPILSDPVDQAGTSGGSTTTRPAASYQGAPVPGQDQPQAYIECDRCSAKFTRRITALKHRMQHDLNRTWFPSIGGIGRSVMSRFIHYMRFQHAQGDLRPHCSYPPSTRWNSPADLNLPKSRYTPYARWNSPADLNLPKSRYTPYARWNSPADLNLPRRNHRQTAGVNVATQERTLAEARPSFSAEDMSRSLSSVVKSSQDSSTGRSFGDMSEIRAALSMLVKSSQDSSRRSGLGDVREIRAALPAFPAALPQEHSSMELNEAAGERKYGLPEVFHSPYRGPRSSLDLSRDGGLGDMSEIRVALPAIPAAVPQERSPMDLSRGGGLGDMSGIRAALPAIPAALPQERSPMDLSRGGGLGDMSGIRATLPTIAATLENDTQTDVKLSFQL